MVNVLDPYWKDVCEFRVGGDKWTTRSPLVDLFKPIQLLPDKENPEKRLACIIPIEDVAHFWDVVLAFYPLFRPDLFESEGHVARMIREFLPKSLQPLNLTPEVVKYIHEMAEGERQCAYWTNWNNLYCAIRVLQLMCVNWPKKDEDFPKFNEQVEKWKDQCIEEESKELKAWEDEWVEILKDE